LGMAWMRLGGANEVDTAVVHRVIPDWMRED
jgi:hypothetical protein